MTGDENRRLRRDLDAATSAYDTKLDRSAVTIQELQNSLKLQQQQLQQQRQQNEHQHQQQQLFVVQRNQHSQVQEHETMLMRLAESDKQIDCLTALVEQTTMKLTALQETQNTTITQHNQLTSQHEQLTTVHKLLLEQQLEKTMKLNALQKTYSTAITQHKHLISQYEQLIEKEQETAIQMEILKEERTTMSHRQLEIEQERAKEMERLFEQAKEKEGERESLMEEFRVMQLKLQQELSAKEQALALTQQQLSEERIGHQEASDKIIELMEEVNERNGAVIQMHYDMSMLQGCLSDRDNAINQLHYDMSVLQGCVDERDGAIIQLQQDVSVLQGCVEERDVLLAAAQKQADDAIALLKHDISLLQVSVNERDSAIIQLQHDITVLQGCVDERDMQINEARINAAEEMKTHIAKLESLQTERCDEESVWQSRLLGCEESIANLTSQCASLQEEKMRQEQAMCLLKNEYEEEKGIMQTTQHQYEQENTRLEVAVVAHVEAARITAHSLDTADITLAEQQREILLLTDRLEVVQAALDQEKYSGQALQEKNSTTMAKYDQLNTQYEQLTSEYKQVTSRYEQLTLEHNQLLVQGQETNMQFAALQESLSTTTAQYHQLQALCRQQQEDNDAAEQSHENHLLVLEDQLQEQLQLQASLHEQLHQHHHQYQQQQQEMELQQCQQETLEESRRQELTALEHRLQQMTTMLTAQQERFETEIAETKKVHAESMRERQGMIETAQQGRLELDGVSDQLIQLTAQLRTSEEEKVTNL